LLALSVSAMLLWAVLVFDLGLFGLRYNTNTPPFHPPRAHNISFVIPIKTHEYLSASQYPQNHLERYGWNISGHALGTGHGASIPDIWHLLMSTLGSWATIRVGGLGNKAVRLA
jgi:hypothetical protein